MATILWIIFLLLAGGNIPSLLVVAPWLYAMWWDYSLIKK